MPPKEPPTDSMHTESLKSLKPVGNGPETKKDQNKESENRLETGPGNDKSEPSIHDVHNPELNMRDLMVLETISEGYVELLRKHLKDVEAKLRDFSETAENNSDAGCKQADTGESIALKPIQISRMPPQSWRQVKKKVGVDSSLDVLLVSSKGRAAVKERSLWSDLQKRTKGVGVESTSIEAPYRLAINSTNLLGILEGCTGISFSEDRNVWIYPFKPLIAYESEIRQALQEAESQRSRLKPNLSPSPQSNNSDSPDHVMKPIPHPSNTGTIDDIDGQNGDTSLDQAQDSYGGAPDVDRSKDELECLVEFMNKDMHDIFEIQRQLLNHKLEDVTFENLWLLYSPGDLIFSKAFSEEDSMCQAYQVLHVTGGRHILDDRANESTNRRQAERDWDPESENEERARENSRNSYSRMTPFLIECFYIDCNGYQYGPKARRFSIPGYRGKRNIRSFEVYPALAHPNYAAVYRKLVRRGQRFKELAPGKHRQYSGRTLRESREISGVYASDNYVIHDEDVRSEVMIDQASAVKHFRKQIYKWNLKLGGRAISNPTIADKRESMIDVLYSEDDDVVSDVFDDSVIDLERRSSFMNSTNLLDPIGMEGPCPADDYLILLPPRIYGYAMRNRKWYPFNINMIQDVTAEGLRAAKIGYQDLVLPPGHKKLLQALVKNQVREMPQGNLSSEDPSMEIVRGKGNGLIILLHGVPGVGKTSTAECVAEQLGRPLLPITCGDISTYVKEAEETLSTYCALAYRWRSVLLLDEADVYLAKREKGDLERNGLVSVFLRVLEYYSGVIILTTNRVGEFDEAFRSRIHVSLYYPKLDQVSTSKIWERNLLRLKTNDFEVDFNEDEIRGFYEKHWRDNENQPTRRWNGRQIKNAFQTALALANWDFHEQPKRGTLERPVLKVEHLDRVAKTSAHFDDYIGSIHNVVGDDIYSVLAERAEFRKDSAPTTYPDRQQQQATIPHSRRNLPTRRGFGTLNEKLNNVTSSQGETVDNNDDDDEEQLELKLKLARLKKQKQKQPLSRGTKQEHSSEGDDDHW